MDLHRVLRIVKYYLKKYVVLYKNDTISSDRNAW